jgi:hypothetical protein
MENGKGKGNGNGNGNVKDNVKMEYDRYFHTSNHTCSGIRVVHGVSNPC